MSIDQFPTGFGTAYIKKQLELVGGELGNLRDLEEKGHLFWEAQGLGVGNGQILNFVSEAEFAGGLHPLLCLGIIMKVSCILGDSETGRDVEYEDPLTGKI